MRLQHVRCDQCAEIFVGRTWETHCRKQLSHIGVAVPVPDLQSKARPKDPNGTVECNKGCGHRTDSRHMKSHEGREHVSCASCGLIMLASKWERHTCEEASKNERLVKETVELCTQFTTAKHEARWPAKLGVIQKLLPQDRPVPFAKLGTLSDYTSGANAFDIFSLKEDEINNLLTTSRNLPHIFVIKQAKTPPANAAESLLQTLDTDLNRRQATINVQDMSTPAESIYSVQDVIEGISKKKNICDGLPFTLLDLQYIGKNTSPMPLFLDDQRFTIMRTIQRRQSAETSRAGRSMEVAPERARSRKDGKQRAAPQDLEKAISFSLFGQKGAFSGFHADCPGGTWVHIASGKKLWMFANTDDFDDFYEYTDDWIPPIQAVILEPGDTLVMMEPTPHAVLTLQDSWMHGGMFIDIDNTLRWMDKLIWVATHDYITNDTIPLQLISRWADIKEFYFERESGQNAESRDAFNALEVKLHRLITCDAVCRSQKGCNSNKNCPCKMASGIMGQQCSAWCHQRNAANNRTQKK